MSKIAFISMMNAAPWGGSEFLWHLAAVEALKAGHQIHYSIYDWSSDVPQIQQLIDLDVRIHTRPRLPSTSLVSRIFNKAANKVFPNRLKSTFQPIFDEQPDLICINQGASYDIAYHSDLCELLLTQSIPYVIVCQCNFATFFLNKVQRECLSQIFKNAVKVLFVSKQNHQFVQHHLAQEVLNFDVIQNPVNLIDTSLISYPQTSTLLFASVARLDTATKGQDILFQNFSQSQWWERNWQLNLYGTGSDIEYLKSLAKFYQISDRVHFAGHVTDIRSLWEKNHILLMPSRAEGCPLSLVEALLCGRPAVVTDVGDSAECVVEGETGFIANSADFLSFSNALEKAWDAREKWEEMGIKANSITSARLDRSPGKTLLKIICESIKR